MDTGGNVWDLPQRQLLLPSFATHFANDNQSGMDAQTYRQSDIFGLFQTDVQLPDHLDNSQTSTDCSLCIIFVSLGIAKVRQETITEKLGDVASIMGSATLFA